MTVVCIVYCRLKMEAVPVPVSSIEMMKGNDIINFTLTLCCIIVGKTPRHATEGIIAPELLSTEVTPAAKGWSWTRTDRR
jgi:hypothetical protein